MSPKQKVDNCSDDLIPQKKTRRLQDELLSRVYQLDLDPEPADRETRLRVMKKVEAFKQRLIHLNALPG